MANTYTSLHYHIVFSTKNRENHIGAEAKDRVWAFLGGIARENKMKALCVGGTENHIHILIMAPAAMALSKMVQLLKGGSSKWIHDTFLGDEEICMAGRIWGVHGQQVADSRGHSVYPRTAGTPSGQEFSGGIFDISENARDRIRRSVCVGMNSGVTT